MAHFGREIGFCSHFFSATGKETVTLTVSFTKEGVLWHTGSATCREILQSRSPLIGDLMTLRLSVGGMRVSLVTVSLDGITHGPVLLRARLAVGHLTGGRG